MIASKGATVYRRLQIASITASQALKSSWEMMIRWEV